MKTATAIVQKLWGYCNVLRDDGMSYADYVEQLTFLLFLKMADERSKPPFLSLTPIPKEISWRGLLCKNEDELLSHYQKTLSSLGGRNDLFGSIYKTALSKFRDPAKFKLIIREIDSIEWAKIDSDVKGETYEGLLEKTATDGKAGAGQYFTPRPVVEAITEVMCLSCKDTICDPAAGTGGFLLSAFKAMMAEARSSSEIKHISEHAIHAVELVDSVARLCLMNLVLHGVGGNNNPVKIADALEQKPEKLFSVVMANPPFGRKSSVTFISQDGDLSKESLSINRDDFWASTSNKQLNFVQHIFSMLELNGRAAVVLPDNVLFEGGAGETVRRNLLEKTDVHTMLRLPAGIFYAQGVKANVLFFDRKAAQKTPCTQRLWIYDFRTNLHFTLKEKTLKRADLDDFIKCYETQDRQQRKESDRFRSFSYDELIKRDKVSLDIFWLKDDALEETANLPPPKVIASEITADLESALEQFLAVSEDLK
jgi:type I restriction enzyme M protein